MTAHDDGVDLNRLQPGTFCRFDSLKHAIQNIDARHLLEDVALQTIETDRDAVEAGLLQTSGAIGKKITVGGQRKISQSAMSDKLQFVVCCRQTVPAWLIDQLKFVGHRRFQLCQFTDDGLDIAPHHRLAAGESNLFNSQLNKNVTEVFNLFVRKHLLFRSDRRLAVRQTIEAAKVAAIGQRHAQIANRATIGIFENDG